MKGIKSLIIDSSIGVKWLNQQDEGYLTQADKILKDAEKGKRYIVMPELAKYEIGNAVLYQSPNSDLVNIALEKFYDLPIEFVPQDLTLATLTMEIAYKLKITYYDASFLALAKKLKAPLVTANPKHQKNITDIKIIPLSKYR